MESANVDLFHFDQKSESSGLFFLLRGYRQKVWPRIWILTGCFDLGCTYLLLCVFEMVTLFVPCILVKMSFVFSHLLILGYMKPIYVGRFSIHWVDLLTLSCVSVYSFLSLFFFFCLTFLVQTPLFWNVWTHQG